MTVTFPTPPTAPSLSNPTDFDTRTDAFLVWMVSTVTTWNATPPYTAGDSPTFADIYNGFGTAALPSYTFTGDTDTGLYRVSADKIGFAAGGSQVAQIDTVSARFFTTNASPGVGDTDTGQTLRPDQVFFSSSGSCVYANTNTVGGANMQLYNNGVGKGSISTNGSAASFNTTSDPRLKENITTIQGAADILRAMRPVTYTMKPDGVWYDGFLADELQVIHPRAVSGVKDAMKDEEYEVSPAVFGESGALIMDAITETRSVPDYMQVDYSKLTPILTAALQEALSKIEALEIRINTLEGN